MEEIEQKKIEVFESIVLQLRQLSQYTGEISMKLDRLTDVIRNFKDK